MFLKLKGDWRKIFLERLNEEQAKKAATGAKLRKGYEEEKMRTASKKIEVITKKPAGGGRRRAKDLSGSLASRSSGKGDTMRISLGIAKKTSKR